MPIFVLSNREAGAVQSALILYVEDEAFKDERKHGTAALAKVRRQRSSRFIYKELVSLACALAKALKTIAPPHQASTP